MIRKVTVAKAAGDDPLEFILSDDTKDRLGDIINPDGWVLSNFKKNPIALFNHNSSFPIGHWANVRVKDNKLIGTLKLAKKGTSDRIDEIIRLVEQDILRAASVGFQPIETEPLADNSGIFFKEQELLETSLVSVPANPAAIQLARSLETSEETIKLVFGEQASKHKQTVTKGTHGEFAATHSSRKTTNMTPLSKRIEDAQERLNTLRDQLTEQLAKMDDENPDEVVKTAVEELNVKIETTTKSLETLRNAEKQLAITSQLPIMEEGGETAAQRRSFAQAARQLKPGDRLFRSIVATVLGQAMKKDPRIMLAERYGEDGKVDDATRTVFDTVTRAASAPATTTTSGWASQLVATENAAFMDLLMPASVYPGLAARGLRLNFGRAGVISIPSRAATPTIAGSFVLEGSPIPVRQGAFTSQTLTPKKLAVISTWTREIGEHSTPALEGLIRNAMQEDTAVAVDTVLLDATAASATRPAGIRNGVSVTTATAGGGFTALVGDLKGLVAALITASNGNLRQPVWIMNPIQALSIAVTQNASGDFPFATEINSNRFQGYPVILSSTVTAGRVTLVDAADFVTVEGAPRFDLSDQATLHLEDTTPLAIGTAGSPATVAAPVRSLYQTDSVALRMIMDLNWTLRRAGVVAWTETITW